MTYCVPDKKKSGESIVCDYNGDDIAVADRMEELMIAEINLQKAAEIRAQKPYTSLRVPDFYE